MKDIESVDKDCKHEPISNAPGMTFNFGDMNIGIAICIHCGKVFAAKWKLDKSGINYDGIFYGFELDGKLKP